MNKTRHTESALTEQGKTIPTNSFKWHGPQIADACVIAHPDANLLVLDYEGGLHFVDTEKAARRHVSTIPLPSLKNENEHPGYGMSCYRLHASANCLHAAVVVDLGNEGVLVEISSGHVIKHLSGGDYYSGTVPFSACFVQHEDRSVLIHRTDWIRLDASDAATGALLTEREQTSNTTGDQRQEYDLGYFHGGLLPSPNGTTLFDDGWVWHPIAVPRIFSVDRWLNENVWESEGPSAKQLMYRDDWDFAACWLDNEHMAWSGLATLGEDDFEENGGSNGVRILNVRKDSDTNRLIPMPEPVIRLFADGPHLHAVSASQTSTWDVASGECVAEINDFAADLFDQKRRILIRILPGEIQTCACP